MLRRLMSSSPIVRVPRLLVRSFLGLTSVLGLLLVLTGCSAAPNTQFVPIGQRCSSSDDCGTPPYDCLITNHPGGYCERTCAIDGDCPPDSYCIGAAHCRRKCTDDSTCREVEGYVCKPNGTNGRYCDVP